MLGATIEFTKMEGVSVNAKDKKAHIGREVPSRWAPGKVGEPGLAVAYCDLDHFKPFNDLHGYRKGDDVLQWTGRLLGERFQSLESFETGRQQFFTDQEQAAGGYETEERKLHGKAVKPAFPEAGKKSAPVSRGRLRRGPRVPSTQRLPPTT